MLLTHSVPGHIERMTCMVFLLHHCILLSPGHKHAACGGLGAGGVKGGGGVRPPAVSVTRLSCVWPAGGGCAPPVISKKKVGAQPYAHPSGVHEETT